MKVNCEIVFDRILFYAATKNENIELLFVVSLFVDDSFSLSPSVHLKQKFQFLWSSEVSFCCLCVFGKYFAFLKNNNKVLFE